ncbi:MAG: hypothetical protein QOI63_1898 [Thermoplasmata archaeon]|jgi:hypothetical protein|nr:hypothetical protein [Thermoplasmata archaeon]
MAPPTPRRLLPPLTTLLLLGSLALAALATPAAASCADTDTSDACNNSGDVKVHTANDIGSAENDPHVACPFYVEGFNMNATSGTLVVKSWPPTGNMSEVLSDTWTADAGVPASHFLNGPYSLPSGHYKLFVSDVQHDKHKVFWVDCEQTTTTTSGTTTTSTEIPVFPSAAALAVGVLGAVGGAAFVLRRRL